MAEASVLRNRNFLVVLGASLTMMMMVAAIVPAFPRIREAFGLDPAQVGLLITVNTLPSFLLVPVAGVLADRLGRKRLAIPSLIMFGIFGGACALAPDFNTLLVLRFFQGVGGVPLQSISFAIIGDLFRGHQRAQAMGINGAGMYTGYIIYPIVGGALAGVGWNYPFLMFLLAIPLGIVAIFAIQYQEPRSSQALRGYLGDALHYLKSWTVAWLFLASIITYILLYGAYLTYFNTLLSDRFHATPLALGLFVSVIGLCTAVVSSQAGRLTKKFPAPVLMTAAFVIYATALVMIPLMPSLWLCLVPAVIYGLGHGLIIPCQTLMASHVTPQEHQAGFMALQTTMIMLGMTIAPLVMGLAYSLTNIDSTFFIAAGIALIGPLAAVIIGVNRLSKQG